MQIDSSSPVSAPLQASFPGVAASAGLRATARPSTPARPSGRPAGSEPRPAETGSDLTIAQLLCSRLCHDLIGPTAAINAGEELIRDESGVDPDDEARELIVESTRQLAGRLAFFRIAFGQGGPVPAGLSYAETRALAEGFLLGGRVRLDWRPDPGDLFGEGALPADHARLILCLIMLAVDALPRGGRVCVRVEADPHGVRSSLTAEGAVARLAPEILAALQAAEPAAVTSRTVHAFYLSRLAARLGVPVELDTSRPGCVRFEAAASPGFVEHRRG